MLGRSGKRYVFFWFGAFETEVIFGVSICRWGLIYRRTPLLD